MDKKDIFKIQHEQSKKTQGVIDRTYSKYDLTEKWLPGNSQNSGKISLNINILKIYYYVIVLIVSVLIGRLFFLQIIQGESYLQASEGNRIRTQVIEAPRGLLLDRNFKPLVRNKPFFYIAFIPADLSTTDILNQQLTIISSITDREIDKLWEEIKKNSFYSYQSVPLVDNLTYEQVVSLKTQLDQWSGFEIGVYGNREYLYGSYTGHILGYLGKITREDLESGLYSSYLLTDLLGKSGLELQYENILRGQSGRREVEIDVRGQIQKIIKEEEPVAGSNLVLTIDVEIQKKLVDLLAEQLQKMGKTKASALAIDPRNGDVLAAVSLPSYDNNLFSGTISLVNYQNLLADENQPLFFRPLQGEYPSGSIFKPLLALAALEDGIITPQTTVLSTGGIRVASWFFPDWKSGGHGLTNLTKAIAESVNTYFFAIGGGYQNIEGLGIEKISNFAKNFYFTKQLGIDYPSERPGFLPSKEWKEEVKKERWYIGDTYNVSIGQGDVLITPLQITTFMSYLANGGTLYRPHFLKEIHYRDGQIDFFQSETLLKNTIEQKNISAVRNGLRAVVEWGSARSLNVLSPFNIAGKTGTAQVGGEKDPHGWFVSFAPYENPTIALTILVENGLGGDTAAVPVAREFYRWYKEYYYDQQ